MKPYVGKDGAHQGYGWDVQSPGHHLGAHQYLGFTAGKTLQNGVMADLIGGVSVPPQGGDSGEQRFQLFDNGLRAESQMAYAGEPAVWAARHRSGTTVALMADQPLRGSMVGERRIAAAASHYVPAVAALHNARRAAAVEEEDGLIALIYNAAQAVLQSAAEDAAVAVPQLLAHIDNTYPGHGAAQANAVRHLQKAQAASGESAVIGNDVRGCAAQDQAALDAWAMRMATVRA